MKLSKKIRNSNQTNCIRATAQSIKYIDLVPSRFVNCSELFLSHNSIRTLGKIDQFHLVSRLMLEYNDICHIEDLNPLGKLPNLTEMRLDGNPVCSLIFWDLHAIDICKKLRLLNGKVVRRTNVKHFLYVESELIEHIYHSEIIRNVLDKLKTIRSITPQKKQKLLEFEFTNLHHNTFTTKIRARTPSKYKNSYMNYLKKKCIKQHSLVDSLIPFSSPCYFNYHDINEKLTLFTEDDIFLKQSQDLIGLGYQAIGLYTDDSFTKLLRDKYQPKENEKKSKKNTKAQTLNTSQIKDKKGKNNSNSKDSRIEEEIEENNLKNSMSKALAYANVQFPEYVEELTEEEPETFFAYNPKLSIQRNSDNFASPKGYNPKLRRIINTFFEVMPRAEEEEEEQQEVQIKIDLEVEEEDTFDLSRFQNNSNSSSEHSVAFEKQLKFAMNEEDCDQLDKKQNDDSDSSKSSFELLNATPLKRPIPVPSLQLSTLENYSPKFLENSRNSARRRAARFSSDEYHQVDRETIMTKIAGIPNSFLGMKFYELWRRRFHKRVNKRVRRNLLTQSASDIANFSNSVGTELSSQPSILDDHYFGNTM